MNQPQPITARGPTGREVRSLAKKTGLDPGALEKLGVRHHAEVVRLAKTARAQAIAKSESIQRVLGGAAVAWANGLQAVATTGQVTRELLDTPFLIWPTMGLTLDAATTAPVNSSVKFHYQSTSKYGLEEVSFFFRWQNPSSDGTTITVDAYIVFTGATQAVSHGGWDLNGRATYLSVYAPLDVFGQWTPAPTLVGSDLAQPVGVTAESDKGLFYQHSAVVNTNVFRGFDLRADPIGVPGNGEVLIQLSAQVQYGMDDGSIDVDFTSGAFNVMTPGVLVTNWS